ncbi:hypothetical protein ACTJLC_29895 [Paraburkholderia sp. 22099]|jgi:hypothetical protein|uniref:hypothetical protein n=1 Tax=Paraburkholderia TaxID=1822464 RepID=UPI0028578140|nr:hypothetical protein [Paraburkholderia terricola]MDR6496462.1 hypothetical protein [Paraburkholderia terricola]
MSTVLRERRPLNFRQRIDYERDLVDRPVFTDDEIYKVELNRVFGRAWLFMCHDLMETACV